MAALLRAAVTRKIEQSEHLKSDSAVSRWLGYEDRSKLGKWMKGIVLPEDQELPVLARLPGITEDDLRAAMRIDRLSAFVEDEEMEDREFLRLAAFVARIGGMTRQEVMELLESTDLDELERAAKSL